MGEVLDQMRAAAVARRARMGMVAARPVVVDRAMIPSMRKLEGLPAEDARAILADELLKNWPAMPPLDAKPVEWNCSLPTGMWRVPGNVKPEPDELPPVAPPMSVVVAVVAREFSVTNAEIVSRTQSRYATFPRQVAMYLGLRSGRTTAEVSRYLGKRDHTTSIHGRQKVEKMVKADPEFAATIKRLEAQLHL